MKKTIIYLLVVIMVCMIAVPVFAAPAKANINVNVLLNTNVNDEILKTLGKHGKVLDVLYEINALTMRVKSDELENIKGLSFVEAANPDAERNGAPIDTIEADTMIEGRSTWDLDVMNVTDFGYKIVNDEVVLEADRVVDEDGTGVYIAVLDTGLLDTWRQYFPEERIAIEYAKSFTGGPVGNVAVQPNKWEHDIDAHGTHVTSSILGYDIDGYKINGVAPYATVIPVKVLNQTGSGWSSVIAKGISYVAELKRGPLANSPVIINMSLGGSRLDAIEEAAILDAIESGVIIVASAGNNGDAGMGYPGAYEPVISVASAGYIGEWSTVYWWYDDVPESGMEDYFSLFPNLFPVDYGVVNYEELFYISSFSGWAYEGQDLDVAAPGSWILGPYQLNRGKTNYYFMGGTSMACPHVSGLVALMAEQNPNLTSLEAETQLENTALDIGWPTFMQGSGIVDAQKALGYTP